METLLTVAAVVVYALIYWMTAPTTPERDDGPRMFTPEYDRLERRRLGLPPLEESET